MKISKQRFKNPGVNKKLKYEELGGDKLKYVEDNFNMPDEQATRLKWISSSFFINKEFKSPHKNDYKFAKNRVREIIKMLHDIIEKD